jgi:hypothetical protein
MKNTQCLIFIFAVIFCLMPRQGSAQLLASDTVSFSLFVNDRFDLMNNFFNSGKLSFDQDRNLHVLYVAPAATITIGSCMQAVVEAEGQFTYEMDGSHDSDQDIDLRNAYLKTPIPGARWSTLSIGQQSLSTAGGFIYDDESPTLRVKADFEKGFDLPLKLDALITRVDQDSPYVHAELRYCFSFLECGSLIYGRYRDTHQGLAHIYNTLELGNYYSGRGKTQWCGFSLRKFLGPVLLRTTALYETGSAHLRSKSLFAVSRSMRTEGYLLDVNFDYVLSDRCTVTAFFFMASGDGSPEHGTFTAFRAINPYIDKTNIFFNGGIDSAFSTSHSRIGSMQLAGVVTPGVSVDIRVNQRIQLKLIGAYLFTQRGPRGQGRVYGWETDFMGYYSINKNAQLFAEANFFNPGNYFKNLTNYQTNISSEFLFGISFLFGN